MFFYFGDKKTRQGGLGGISFCFVWINDYVVSGFGFRATAAHLRQLDENEMQRLPLPTSVYRFHYGFAALEFLPFY